MSVLKKTTSSILSQPNINSDINFVYKKVKVSHTSLTYWIENDEFAEKVRILKNQNISITDHMIFEIMREIYISKSEEWSRSGKKPDFNFSLAKKCIKNLYFSFTGSKTGWETR